MSACSKIRHIVRLRQMLRRWRRKATKHTPSDVPTGHVAVTVGPTSKRFVVRATYLNHPLFRSLLVQAEEEYGFSNSGPLAIPCDEFFFEELMNHLARVESNGNVSARFIGFKDFQGNCNVGGFRNNYFDPWTDSRPLLNGVCHDYY